MAIDIEAQWGRRTLNPIARWCRRQVVTEDLDRVGVSYANPAVYSRVQFATEQLPVFQEVPATVPVDRSALISIFTQI